jgi:cell division protein FtsB
MRSLGSLLILLPLALLGGAAGAQDRAAAPAKTAASPAQKKLDELIERVKQKRKEVGEAYEKATTDEERNKLMAAMPGKDFVTEFRAVAEEAKGTDTAARAWMWCLQLGQGDRKGVQEIVPTMLEDHMDSDVLVELTGFLRYGATALGGEAPVAKTLQDMIEYSSNDKVRASAMHTLGLIQLDSSNAAKRAEGRKLLERVVAEFASVKTLRGGTYGEVVTRYLYALDNLQLGKVAPDFETVDENGVKWKLSDYRGKVVVVDFWGYW